MEEIAGARLLIESQLYVNFPKESEPKEVSTYTLPVAPLATTAFIVESFFTVNDEAGVPPKFIEVAPVKFFPVIVILLPSEPAEGVKEIILGTGIPDVPNLVMKV